MPFQLIYFVSTADRIVFSFPNYYMLDSQCMAMTTRTPKVTTTFGIVKIRNKDVPWINIELYTVMFDHIIILMYMCPCVCV